MGSMQSESKTIYSEDLFFSNKYVKENLTPIKIEKKPISINTKIDWTDDKDKKLKMLFNCLITYIH